MSFGSIRSVLSTVHRWAGIVLAPLFLIVIVSGGVLAFRPIVDAPAPVSASSRVDVAALTSLVQRLNGLDGVAAISVVQAGRFVDVEAGDPSVAGRWEVETGRRVGETPLSATFFDVTEQLHKKLLLGLGSVVEFASWVMLGIVLVGPLLAWLRFRNTLIGWHTAVGWCLLPLAVMSPLTGILMTLHVGESATPLPRAARPVSVVEALTIAAPQVDLGNLVEAHRFRGGTVMLRVRAEPLDLYVVTEESVVRLVDGPPLIKRIHEGTWGGPWSGLLNLVAALALALLAVTGPVSWFARWRRNRATAISASADLLVVHASQTGTATRFAEATADALRRGGEDVALAPIGSLDPNELARFRFVLFLVSTTGEGDLPDVARRFVDALGPDGLRGVRCVVFGLGDRSYTHFCGGAERLRTALRLAGATEAMPPVHADGDPTAAWSEWIESLDMRLGLKVARGETMPGEPAVTVVLDGRYRLDDPSRGETQETWAVVLTSPTPLSFRPGDLIRIAPEPGQRERTYSVGTSSRIDDRRIVLTVALNRWRNDLGQSGVGAMSELLTQTLPLGSSLTVRLTAHPSFNPPDDPKRAIIMIAAGSGVAPFYGFAAERRASGHAGPAWLIFGNRVEAADFLWKEHFTAALADGSLTRLDTAFSPRAGVGVRVQERLLQEGEEAFRWIVERDAVLYVCGRRVMVEGVLEAVGSILIEHSGFSPNAARAEIDARIAAGSIRIDSFG